MPDTELLIPMAEIAGVFVGFGALIAVRSAGTTGAELTNIRWVMSCAMWVVIVGLAPALVGSYGLAGHDLLLASSILALVLWATFLAVNARAPENREELRANVAASSPTMMLVYVATLWPPTRVLSGPSSS